MTESEQWAVELAGEVGAWMRVSDERLAALTIQRAFEERERKLREAAIAQPSGDEVEAVALAILNSDRGMRGLDPLQSRENVPDSDGYVTNATAAITTYEAVSGVAKMREALRPFANVTILPDGSVVGLERHWFTDARAALGEKP